MHSGHSCTDQAPTAVGNGACPAMADREPHCDEVIVNWIGGTRFAAKRGMTGVAGNIYAGLHEFGDMAFMLHFLRAGDLLADVGQYRQLHSPGIGRH
jgi:hypothetical protein